MTRKEKLKRILSLFLTFLKIGGFTFGGGYAMIPLIQKEVVDNKKWVTDDDILEIIAIAESTPGPIAINSATFIGYKTCGFFGSFFATLGVVLPSFVIIMIIAFLLNGFAEITAVKYAFFGIRAGVLALLLKSFWGMFKKCPKNAVAYSIAAAAFIASILSLDTLVIIISAAVIGLASSYIAAKREVK
ncbi:MAG: chromate transporter [Clostridia bacterium]|nr:chromate transporter [Clostridia bacterium]MBQ9920026.1 chromate transporter [Clostridia bacterium]